MDQKNIAKKSSKTNQALNSSQKSKKAFKLIIRRVIIIALALLLLLSGYFIIKTFFFSNNEKPGEFVIPQFTKLEKPITILLAGTDQEYEKTKYGYVTKVENTFNGRTDTIIVCKFDPETKTIAALNVPRDTKITFNANEDYKINSLNPIGGPKMLIRTLKALLGLEIENYVYVNTNGVADLIDQLGGIEVNVPQRMKYRDKTDGLEIDLKPGKQILGGKEALGFVRYRNTSLGDIGRLQRQQMFIRAVKQKLKDPSIALKFPGLLKRGLKVISTDLDARQIIQLINFSKDIPNEAIMFATLPGTFSAPVMEERLFVNGKEVDPDSLSTTKEEGTEDNEENKEIADSLSESAVLKKARYYHSPFHKNSSQTQEENQTSAENEENSENTNLSEAKVVMVEVPSISYWIPTKSQVDEVVENLFKTSSESEKVKSNRQIKIAIENTTGNASVSRQLSQKLIKEGFRVIDVTSSDKALPSSIYAQKGNLKDAHKVYKALFEDTKVKGLEVLAGSNGSPIADVTITIGKGFEEALAINKD